MTVTGYASDAVLVDADWARAHLDDPTVCRIGERSSHTWFVLHELLGYVRVRYYDGSRTKWGSMVGER